MSLRHNLVGGLAGVHICANSDAEAALNSDNKLTVKLLIAGLQIAGILAHFLSVLFHLCSRRGRQQ